MILPYFKTAVSFGEGYGPKLIKKKGTKLKKNFKVALSGEFTTNALLFKMAYPDAQVGCGTQPKII